MPKHPSNKYRNICKRKSKLQEDKRELTWTILETTPSAQLVIRTIKSFLTLYSILGDLSLYIEIIRIFVDIVKQK